MLISEYLQMRNLAQIKTGNVLPDTAVNTAAAQGISKTGSTSPSFSDILKATSQQQTVQTTGVEFSRHALDRLVDRNIDLSEGNKLERLNKAVEVAQEKGANETLVLVDSTAFLVSVKNNKVITTLSAEDLQGNIFTNIDSTVIM